MKKKRIKIHIEHMPDACTKDKQTQIVQALRSI
jgi:hypothetical protein